MLAEQERDRLAGAQGGQEMVDVDVQETVAVALVHAAGEREGLDLKNQLFFERKTWFDPPGAGDGSRGVSARCARARGAGPKELALEKKERHDLIHLLVDA